MPVFGGTYVGGKKRISTTTSVDGVFRAEALRQKPLLSGLLSEAARCVLGRPSGQTRRPSLLSHKKAIGGKAIIYADDYKAYNGIINKRVNHSGGKYAIGGVHTNSIESFWSLFKRGYIGICPT